MTAGYIIFFKSIYLVIKRATNMDPRTSSPTSPSSTIPHGRPRHAAVRRPTRDKLLTFAELADPPRCGRCFGRGAKPRRSIHVGLTGSPREAPGVVCYHAARRRPPHACRRPQAYYARRQLTVSCGSLVRISVKPTVGVLMWEAATVIKLLCWVRTRGLVCHRWPP